MKIDPKGSMPPNITITRGSINHFFSPLYLCCATVWDFLPPAPTILLRQNMKRVADMPVSRSVLHTKR